MKLDRYDFFVSDSGLDYAFVSEGPKGNIIKLVNFHRSYVEGKNVFNLSFGDWNERRQKIDDRINSNNNDGKKEYWPQWHQLFFIFYRNLAMQQCMRKAARLQEQDYIRLELLRIIKKLLMFLIFMGV